LSLEAESDSSFSLASAFAGAGTFADLVTSTLLVEGPASFSLSESLEEEEDDDEDSETFRLLRFLFRLRWVERLGAGAAVGVVGMGGYGKDQSLSEPE
jgi:hypothetical protein